MKKFSITLIITVLYSLNFNCSYAQEEAKTKTLRVHSSINCEPCEELFEEIFYSIDGIVHYGVDIDENIIEVKFNSIILSEEAIKNAILERGFPVDKKEGDRDAYMELPDCCKKVEDQSGAREQEIDPDNAIEENVIELKEDKKKKKDKKKDKESGGDDSEWE